MLYLQVFFQQGKEVNKKLLIQVSSFYRLICKHYLQSFWTRHTSYDTNSWKHSHYQGYTADQWRQSGHKTAMNLIPSLSSMGPVFFNSFHIPWTSLLATAATKSSVCQHKCMDAGRHLQIHRHTHTYIHLQRHTHTWTRRHSPFLSRQGLCIGWWKYLYEHIASKGRSIPYSALQRYQQMQEKTAAEASKYYFSFLATATALNKLSDINYKKGIAIHSS